MRIHKKCPRTTIKVLRNSLYWYDTVEPPWLPPLARDLYKTQLPYPSSGSPTDPTSYWNSLGISLEPDWQIDNTFFDRPVMARTQILVYNQHHHLLRWWCNNFLFFLTSCQGPLYHGLIFMFPYLSAAEAPPGYPSKNSNNRKISKRAGDDRNRQGY